MSVTEDYYNQMYRLGQVETYDGFWWKFLNNIGISRYYITIYTHKINRQIMLNITLEDLIWMICLFGFFLAAALGISSYFTIYHMMEAKYIKEYHWNRQYDVGDYRLPTEHPDYVKKVLDVVPSRDMAIINKFIMEHHYPQVTNYCKVIDKTRGFVMDVTDEEFKEALREFRHQKLVNLAKKNGTMK